VYADVHTASDPAGNLRGTVEATETSTAVSDAGLEAPTPVAGRDVRVTVSNAAPEVGTYQAPVWVGFHDGIFDARDISAPANAHPLGTNVLEPLAEDGDRFLLVGAFTIQAHGKIQGVLAGVLGPEPSPIAPREPVSRVFRVDPSVASRENLHYASLIIPSDDAFVSNASGTDVPMYSGGSFGGADVTVTGSSCSTLAPR
jgi:hypothetical protein